MDELELLFGLQIKGDLFPLLDYTIDIIETLDTGVDIDPDMLHEGLEPGQKYLALPYSIIKEMSPHERKDLVDWLRKINPIGEESTEKLEAIYEESNSSLANIVQKIITRTQSSPTAIQLRELAQMHENIDDELKSRGASASLDEFLRGQQAGMIVKPKNHGGINSIDKLAPEQVALVGKQVVPLYVLCDTSKSTEKMDRYTHLQSLCLRLYENRRTQQLNDSVSVFRYSHDVERLTNFGNVELIFPEGDTATGNVLYEVGEEIKIRYPKDPVCVSLITDGYPTWKQDTNGNEVDAQEYAEQMAASLPKNVRLFQFAFSYINPEDHPQEFEAYLDKVCRVSDAAPHGQTIVLVPYQEASLPYLVESGHQHTKQLKLIDGS